MPNTCYVRLWVLNENIMTYEYSNFRIVKTKKGYRVDIQKTKWTLFGLKKYWTHFISYSGLSEHPFYYSTFETAMSEMLKEIRWEVLANFSNETEA